MVLKNGNFTCRDIGESGRSVGRVFCCYGAVATTAVRSEESALIQSFSQAWEKGAEGGMRVVALSDGLTLPRTIAGPLA